MLEEFYYLVIVFSWLKVFQEKDSHLIWGAAKLRGLRARPLRESASNSIQFNSMRRSGRTQDKNA